MIRGSSLIRRISQLAREIVGRSSFVRRNRIRFSNRERGNARFFFKPKPITLPVSPIIVKVIGRIIKCFNDYYKRYQNNWDVTCEHMSLKLS